MAYCRDTMCKCSTNLQSYSLLQFNMYLVTISQQRWKCSKVFWEIILDRCRRLTKQKTLEWKKEGGEGTVPPFASVSFLQKRPVVPIKATTTGMIQIGGESRFSSWINEMLNQNEVILVKNRSASYGFQLGSKCFQFEAEWCLTYC